MTLKQKALLLLISLGVFFISILSLVIYQIMTVSFQQIENQRVDRNIRRVQAIIDDRFSQLSSKLTDWTNWDDTYKFMDDENDQYVESNLPVNAFEGIGVDKSLFINKMGKIIWEVDVTKDFTSNEVDMSIEFNKLFATGSALLKVNKETGLNKGIVKVDEGLLLFVVREVFRSGGDGEANGYMVFGRYFDKEIMDSMVNLTQFEAQFVLWNDLDSDDDYQEVRDEYEKNGKISLVKVLNDQTISGYLVVEDINKKPVAIVRSDIGRDIALQGKTGMKLLVGILILIGSTIVMIDYLLLVNVVLKKILLIADDVDKLRVSHEKKHLKVEGVTDEVDRLRIEINEMLDSLENEKHKGETLIDLVNALVMTLDNSGEVLMINKKGLEMLGYTSEEVVGKNWFQNFVSQEDKGKVFEVFTKLTEDILETNSENENEVVTKDNRKLLISWHNTVVKDGNGKVISTLSLGEDITFKKEEEKRKEEYGKELERLNGAMVGRELKMIELKNEIDRLKISAGGIIKTEKNIKKEEVNEK